MPELCHRGQKTCSVNLELTRLNAQSELHGEKVALEHKQTFASMTSDEAAGETSQNLTAASFFKSSSDAPNDAMPIS